MKKRKIIEGDLFNTPGFFEEFVKVQGFVIINKTTDTLIRGKSYAVPNCCNDYLRYEFNSFTNKWNYFIESANFEDLDFIVNDVQQLFSKSVKIELTDIPELALIFETKTQANTYLIDLKNEDVDISGFSIIKYLDLE